MAKISKKIIEIDDESSDEKPGTPAPKKGEFNPSDCKTYLFGKAHGLKAYFKCKSCHKETSGKIHIYYTAFSFDPFAQCSFCKKWHQLNIFSIG